MIKKTFSSVAVLLPMFFSAAAASQVAEAANASYKGTKFNVSEKLFSQQHQNEGFVCTNVPYKAARECNSEVTTYAGFKGDTKATFINDKLVSVVVFFREPSDLSLKVSLDALIVLQLEGQYGPPDEVMWPEEQEREVKVWKKVWHKPDGSTIGFVHTVNTGNPPNVDIRTVYLTSKDLEKLSKDSEKAYKRDL